LPDLSQFAPATLTADVSHLPVSERAALDKLIEAARLLGWEAIPATVVEVADLLAAERDENAERKDFTPTEAVAIGALIEATHRAKIARQSHDLHVQAGKIRHGISTNSKRDLAGPTSLTAARAVGMGAGKYEKAKAVVAAASAEPERFGDLPSRMDETGNVSGAHREMERRKSDGAQGRHPVHHRSHHRDQTKEMDRAVAHLEGAASVVLSIDPAAIDQARRTEWAESLGDVRANIGQVIKKLRG